VSSTAQPATTTARTPMSMSWRATLTASLLKAIGPRSMVPRWQQLRNTSSGTVSIASISAAVMSRPSDSTTPLRSRPSAARSSYTPWPAMCTMR